MSRIYEFTDDFIDINGMSYKKGYKAFIENNNVRNIKGGLIFCLNSHNAEKYGRVKMVKEKRKMNKSDLKTGMVVELKDGSKLTVMEVDEEKIIFDNEDSFNLKHWSDDLTYRFNDSSYVSIVKVYKPQNMNGLPMNYEYILESELIWERETVTKYSLIEIMQRYDGKGKIMIKREEEKVFETLDNVILDIANYAASDRIPKVFLEEVFILEDESILKEDKHE